MDIGDAVIGLPVVYFAWRQNEIFQRQNDIFATQAGMVTSMRNDPHRVRSWIGRYWPTFVLMFLIFIAWVPFGYRLYHEYFGDQKQLTPDSSGSPFAPWLLGVGIVALVGYDVYRRFSKKSAQAVEIPLRPSESLLTIHSAKYGAGQGEEEDITSGLQNKGTRLVLPEDSRISELTKELNELKAKSESQSRTALANPAPANAADIVWNWRKMVTDAQKEHIERFAHVLTHHQDYPSLRPHLTQREALEGTTLFLATTSAVHPIVSSVPADIDRVAVHWGLPTEPSGRAAVVNSQLSDEDRIKITLPLPGEALIDKQPLGPKSVSHAVRGTLRSLPEECEIWLLTADEKTKRYWPQGFSAVQYNRQTGDWQGRVHAGHSPLQIVAVVAPPTSQQLFRYFQKRGDETKLYAPLGTC